MILACYTADTGTSPQPVILVGTGVGVHAPGRRLTVDQKNGNRSMYAVVEKDGAWVLRRNRTALVEFPSRDLAVRAGMAVCRDEGLPRLLVRGADGEDREVLLQPIDV